ncbi:aspartate:alanine exchanger family transporter [Desulfonatronovibrio hydrogenovorans]|uniref:aspartate:alanine exchanger family transporter n=1 Tax=Desulfonatronovibrio hydrogenovorans TaxID=53245 RepID=UPI00048CE3EC|nr:TrkA C-terminal domain-containing protein [Desulfonatronovibrio hydrogenovorans]
MEIDLIGIIRDMPELLFFLILGLGYLVGNIKVRGFELGSTTGVLLTGLFFGHFGFELPANTLEIGFILFIYSVGLQAGPRFFSVFLEDGLKYVTLALVVSISAVALAFGISSYLGFSRGISAGLLSGALTSTPTLAAAQDAVHSGLARLPESRSADLVIQDIGSAYAITYLFGLIGLLAFIRLIPYLLKFNLAQEAVKLARQKRFTPEDDDSAESSQSQMLRAYRVQSDQVVGRPLKDLSFTTRTGCVIQSVIRGKEKFAPGADTVLEQNDRVSVVGPLEGHERMEKMLGPEVLDKELLTTPVKTHDVVVTHPDAVGRSLGDLHYPARYGCFVTRVSRSHVNLPIDESTVLEKGDVVRVTGARDRLEELIRRLGHVERNIIQTDLLTFALGIAAGLFVGKITFKVGALSLGLGTAGGLLLTGILIGFLRSIHPTFGRVPPAARWLFMELGLLFFMAGIGLKAGPGIVDAVLTLGPVLFVSGIVITTVPVIVGFVFGKYVLKFNPVILLGAITGAMTSTPALNAVIKAAGSPVPALGYAGTYAFANVFLALAGTLIMML